MWHPYVIASPFASRSASQSARPLDASAFGSPRRIPSSRTHRRVVSTYSALVPGAAMPRGVLVTPLVVSRVASSRPPPAPSPAASSLGHHRLPAVFDAPRPHRDPQSLLRRSASQPMYSYDSV